MSFSALVQLCLLFCYGGWTGPPSGGPTGGFPSTCVIKLDQLQYTFYKKSRLEIHSPEGKVLTVIGKPLPNKTDEDALFQLWSQACLLEVLFDEINERVKLPQRAINSIAHVIGRIDGHLKKQTAR